MDPVQQAYGVMADQYIDFINGTEVHADDLRLIARHLSVRPGMVLDVGCGPGHLTAHLRSLGIEAIGIDLVRAFVEHARAEHPGVSYGLGSLRQLPVPDHSVTGILAWYSLIHLPPADIDRVLAELHRALAPGGRLVVGFCEGDEVVPFDHRVVTAWYWPAEAFAQRLHHAGFTEIERQQRPGSDAPGQRPHAAIAASAATPPAPPRACT